MGFPTDYYLDYLTDFHWGCLMDSWKDFESDCLLDFHLDCLMDCPKDFHLDCWKDTHLDFFWGGKLCSGK